VISLKLSLQLQVKVNNASQRPFGITPAIQTLLPMLYYYHRRISMKLLKFYADWCGPCKMLSRVMEDVTLPYPVEEINIDNDQALPVKYGIRGVPTLVLVDDDNNEIRRVSGMLMESQLIAFVNKDQ